MNRIDRTFLKLREQKQKAFLVYITAGDPHLKMTEKLVLALDQAGVDIIELGVPFSDPLADGPTIQAASQRALKKGVTLEKIFRSVRNLRKKTDIPIVLMTYYNPVFHFGEGKFVNESARSGVDGLIVPDLPPEEAQGLIQAARKQDLSTIFFIAPTTTMRRVKHIVAASTGFIYYVSLTGVTGARRSLPKTLITDLRKIKRIAKKPVCAGFGISNPAQVKEIQRVADGVIVGSAIIQQIEKHGRKAQLPQIVARHVRSLMGDQGK